uniref:DUF676 domain-containing protein n=1 Tax=Palpitomonas bilix TaxID=652834 RepID=A0A7S3GG85_9EUKA|mmetsp:Transcript_47860/g.124214  ORF Transcript_47860/g.124214 Transcript_47860/m.124214 type:complete len:614 (+) Transcript_47860:67-1908(+)
MASCGENSDPVRVILLFPGFFGGPHETQWLDGFLFDYCRWDGKGDRVIYTFGDYRSYHSAAGVEKCAKMAWDEFWALLTEKDGEFACLKKSRRHLRFYLIGHSMGGLIAEVFVAFLLQAEDFLKSVGVLSVRVPSLITLQSPHGGLKVTERVSNSASLKGKVTSFFSSLLSSFSPFQTLGDMALKPSTPSSDFVPSSRKSKAQKEEERRRREEMERRGEGGKSPLLFELTSTSSRYQHALNKIENTVLFACIVGDTTVPYCSAAARRANPFLVSDEGRSILEEAMVDEEWDEFSLLECALPPSLSLPRFSRQGGSLFSTAYPSYCADEEESWQRRASVDEEEAFVKKVEDEREREEELRGDVEEVDAGIEGPIEVRRGRGYYRGAKGHGSAEDGDTSGSEKGRKQAAVESQADRIGLYRSEHGHEGPSVWSGGKVRDRGHHHLSVAVDDSTNSEGEEDAALSSPSLPIPWFRVAAFTHDWKKIAEKAAEEGDVNESEVDVPAEIESGMNSRKNIHLFSFCTKDRQIGGRKQDILLGKYVQPEVFLSASLPIFCLITACLLLHDKGSGEEEDMAEQGEEGEGVTGGEGSEEGSMEEIGKPIASKVDSTDWEWDG